MNGFHSFGALPAAALASLLLPFVVSGECLDPANASITEGAWNMIGVNRTWIPARLDENNINTQNPTWDVPDGTWSYPQGEVTNYGPNYLTQYTCSKLTFCNPEGDSGADGKNRRRRRHLQVDKFSQQDVWKLPTEDAFENCDFTNARLMGTTSATACVEIEKDDRAFDGETSFYASKEHCAAGQKVAVTVAKWKSFADECAALAFEIPAPIRLRSCDCDFARVPFQTNFPAICAQSYQDACLDMEQPGECCYSMTCMSKIETFDTDEGREYELNRRESCDDDTPGLCYNADGVASEMSMDGSTDCCTQTCSTCGTELAPGTIWKPCTTKDSGSLTARCGKLSRYALEEFQCDFSKCPQNSHWGSKGEAIWKYMELSGPSGLDIPDEGATDTAAPPMSQDTAMNEDSGASSGVLSAVASVAAGIVAVLL